MAETTVYTVARTRYGAILEIGDLRLEAGSPHIDRGVVRATLSAWNGVLLYRDTANLTSSRMRARTVAALAERCVIVADGALIALDEACRRTPPGNAEHTTPDGGRTFRKRS